MLAPSVNSPINTIMTRAARFAGRVGLEFGVRLEPESE